MEDLVAHKIRFATTDNASSDPAHSQSKRPKKTPLEESEALRDMHPAYWKEADDAKKRRPTSARATLAFRGVEEPPEESGEVADITPNVNSNAKRRPQSARLVRDIGGYFSEASAYREKEATTRPSHGGVSSLGGIATAANAEEAAQAFAGVGNISNTAPPAYPFDPSQRPYSANRTVPRPPAKIVKGRSSSKGSNEDKRASAHIPSSATSKQNLLISYAKAATRPGRSASSFLTDFVEEEMEVMAKLLGKAGSPYDASSWRAGDAYLGGIDHRIMKVPDFRTMSPRAGPVPPAHRSTISASAERSKTSYPIDRQEVSSAARHVRGVRMDTISSRPTSAAQSRPTTPRQPTANTASAHEEFSSSTDDETDVGGPLPFSKTAVFAPCKPQAVHRGSTRSLIARISVSHAQRQRESREASTAATAATPVPGGRLNTRPSSACLSSDNRSIPQPPARAQIIYNYDAYQPAPSSCIGPPPTIMQNDYGVRKHVASIDLGKQSPRAQGRFASNTGPPPSIARTHETIAAAIGYSGSIATYFGMRDSKPTFGKKGQTIGQVANEVPKRTIRAQPADDEEVLAQLLCDEPDRRYVLSDLGETRVRARAALRAHYRHRPYTLPSRYDDGGMAATATSGIYSMQEHPQHRSGPDTARRIKGVDMSSMRYTSASALPNSRPPSASKYQRTESPSNERKAYSPGAEAGWRLRSVFDAYGPK